MDSTRRAALPKWQTPSIIDPAAGPQIDPDVIRRQAEAEGYTQGLENGRAEMQRRLARLQEVLDLFERPLRDLDRASLDQLTMLALAVAQAVLQQELKTDPALVGRLVEAAFGFLDLGQERQLRILLHPADLPLVSEHLTEWQPDCQWTLVPDEHLHRGQCQLVAGTATIDGSLQARLDAVLAQMLEHGSDA